MAVQAQYPSNVLLLNRNIQEDHDFSLQPQPGGVVAAGGVLPHPHLLFNNGGGNDNNMNLRKRGRDVSVSAPTIINHPLCFHHQSQIIEISQLHSHHQSSNVVSTGLRLSSGDQQHKLHQHPPAMNENNLVSLSSSVLLSSDFASHIKQQRDEIDQILQAQEEELRRALAEKRQRHFRELVGAAEETAARKLREKETEVEKATRRNAELEARAARVSMEAQAWQAKARAQEAAAAALQAQLQQAVMRGAGMGGGGEGGGDCTVGAAEDAESAYVDPERVAAGSGPSCKVCRKRVASVVLLPCRHLCVCTDCDQVVRACPICRAFRNSSVEVFLS
ncbi:BOI-related E3 ubiquitin-protein ligase 1-like [Momordica charantia]|uniref:BOI-related E3 ubiquitin-protein ligase 1-like n=1 Tax=Momordica charantia TaxID=3673 RepID=A0A6J1DQF4_MOMCH|nr:BOI-related E3 ubiquitin-protein ligase 1-like [Momordica charantia]